MGNLLSIQVNCNSLKCSSSKYNINPNISLITDHMSKKNIFSIFLVSWIHLILLVFYFYIVYFINCFYF